MNMLSGSNEFMLSRSKSRAIFQLDEVKGTIGVVLVRGLKMRRVMQKVQLQGPRVCHTNLRPFSKHASKTKDHPSAFPVAKHPPRFRVAAGQGHISQRDLVEHHYRALGNGYLAGGDRTEAARVLRRVAEQGSVDAMTSLGLCYRDGVGVQQDAKEALRLLQIATDKGSALAQARLGECYADGIGVEQNSKEAMRLFRAAASRGNAQGQLHLAAAYASGKIVPEDRVEAARLYQLAAEQGHPLAQLMMGLIFESGYGGVPKDMERAAKSFRLSADQGVPRAKCCLYLLAKRYDKYGEGGGGGAVPRDKAKVERLYRLASASAPIKQVQYETQAEHQEEKNKC